MSKYRFICNDERYSLRHDVGSRAYEWNWKVTAGTSGTTDDAAAAANFFLGRSLQSAGARTMLLRLDSIFGGGFGTSNSDGMAFQTSLLHSTAFIN